MMDETDLAIAPTTNRTSPLVLPSYHRPTRQSRLKSCPLRLSRTTDSRRHPCLAHKTTASRKLPECLSTDQLWPDWSRSHRGPGPFYLLDRCISLYPTHHPEQKPMVRYQSDPDPPLHQRPHVQPHPQNTLCGWKWSRRNLIFCWRLPEPVWNGDSDCGWHV